jgi:energy-coupling factor transporter ATP-binding protein EcfA2
MASPHPTTAPATGVLPESAAGTGTPLLEARSLVKEYGSLRAVDGLTLAVKGGEIYCLLGPNGAGKSTTINCFLGFATPTSGQVLIKGMEVGAAPCGDEALAGLHPGAGEPLPGAHGGGEPGIPGLAGRAPPEPFRSWPICWWRRVSRRRR